MPKEKTMKSVEKTTGEDTKIPVMENAKADSTFEARMNIMLFTPDKVKFSANLRFPNEGAFQDYVSSIQYIQIANQGFQVITIDKELAIIPASLFRDALITFVR